MSNIYFEEQERHTGSYLLPYFETHIPDFASAKVLEVGCAEAGLLNILYQRGMSVAGVELLPDRARTALEVNPNLKIIVGDATDPRLIDRIDDTFDLIILRETIEHIPNRIALFNNIIRLLKDGGHLYVTFPPRFSAFAGHQQGCRSVLRFVPWLHYLPDPLIRGLCNLFKEEKKMTDWIILNYKVGLSIRAFEQYYSRYHFVPVVKDLFLLRPVYEARFNVRPLRFPNIPFVREFMALGCEYLLRKVAPSSDLTKPTKAASTAAQGGKAES